ncbi:MAG: hypothetical protein HQK64_00590 [Desulfamplus sp.]|nr:hypothetical protein [Desulfamplus sp.]MBF0240960.1 hypothetical protein [Desulfamplus sp.]MBF0389735.1 hypothetical protein [Desulfamplus sp.]
MFPFCFEWVWDAGHYLFFGGMWYTIIILSLGMTFCIVKTIIDTAKGGGHGHHGGHGEAHKPKTTTHH